MQHPQYQEYYVSRGKRRHGPYTWEELVGHARAGTLAARDRVYSPLTGTWRKASQVPGLTGPKGTPLRSRAWLGWTAATMLVAAGVVAYLAWAGHLPLPRRDSDAADTAFVEPDPERVVDSTALGPVPVDQIGVWLADGEPEETAEEAADAVGGEVAGGLADLGIYQITFDGTTEADLETALDAAEAVAGVEVAFPNQVSWLRGRTGRPCTPADGVVYQGKGAVGARAYEVAGVGPGWDLVRMSGIDPAQVVVGIADGKLWADSPELGAVESEPQNTEDPFAASGTVPANGNHAAAVAGIVAADPSRVGMAGVGTVLGDKMAVVHEDIMSEFGKAPQAVAYDPGDYTLADTGKTTEDGTRIGWALTELEKLDVLARMSDVVNISLGNSAADPRTAAAWRRFFENKAADPDFENVVFVVAAGNDGRALDTATSFPGGYDLPNVITVASIMNDGSPDHTSNINGPDYKVDLAAPGGQSIVGVSPTGESAIMNGGGTTSFAAPYVTSAVAIMKSLDPSLTAKQIKDILTRTARKQVESGGLAHAVPDSMGAGCLALDSAVLEVVNGRRTKQGEGTLTMEAALSLSRVTLSANDTGEGTWRVTASVAAAAGTVSLQIRAPGATGMGGASSKSVAAGEQATWDVTVPEGGGVTVHVSRSDTGACSRVRIGAEEPVVVDEPPRTGTPDAGGATEPDRGPITDLDAAILQAADSAGISYGRLWEPPADHPIWNNEYAATGPVRYLDGPDNQHQILLVEGYDSEATASQIVQRFAALPNVTSTTFHGEPAASGSAMYGYSGSLTWRQGRYVLWTSYWGGGDWDAFNEAIWDVIDRYEP